MTCPKCQGEMRTYERNGIHVDQCSECRGLFLDRGELEHLVQAEGSFYGGGGGGGSEPRRQEHEHRDRDSYSYGGKHYKKRKKNFLEELFD
ncbi:MAG TPA: zf-TFIIB domain-containing protein [Solirubrobacteraceae bacterium]|nr:zf-TFIIB domain-containing protein [Solirubrobacteraceae bacterium]